MEMRDGRCLCDGDFAVVVRRGPCCRVRSRAPLYAQRLGADVGGLRRSPWRQAAALMGEPGRATQPNTVSVIVTDYGNFPAPKKMIDLYDAARPRKDRGVDARTRVGKQFYRLEKQFMDAQEKRWLARG